MIRPATDLRAGMAIRLNGELYRVLEARFHAGGGQMKGAVHARLQSLKTGGTTERRLRPEERIEEVELTRQEMEYLYDEGDQCVFMHPVTFDQMLLPRESLGPYAPFLQPNQRLNLEFLDDQPVGLAYPKTVDLKVARTAEPLHTTQDTNVLKEAVLENGMTVLVPQFVRSGDLVRIEVETRKYVDRIRQTT
jgi:elongation factor P